MGYRDLLQVNERFFELDDKKLLDLIVQVTGTAADSSVAKQTVYTLKNVKSLANFGSLEEPKPQLKNNEVIPHEPARMNIPEKQNLGLNLAYTINLNLPATSDQAVFNAIFRSLKEHLLSDEQ